MWHPDDTCHSLGVSDNEFDSILPSRHRVSGYISSR